MNLNITRHELLQYHLSFDDVEHTVVVYTSNKLLKANFVYEEIDIFWKAYDKFGADDKFLIEIPCEGG